MILPNITGFDQAILNSTMCKQFSLPNGFIKISDTSSMYTDTFRRKPQHI